MRCKFDKNIIGLLSQKVTNLPKNNMNYSGFFYIKSELFFQNRTGNTGLGSLILKTKRDRLARYTSLYVTNGIAEAIIVTGLSVSHFQLLGFSV